MREELEIIIAEAQPWIDRNAPPPNYKEIECITAVLEYNPRGNHVKRDKAARRAIDEWLHENGGRLRSVNPTAINGDEVGFLAVIDNYKPAKKKKPVTHTGPHAPRNRLVKR